jgi:signal transduction histidine kinase
MKPRHILRADELVTRIEVARAIGPVALLVLRLPEFAEIAWRDGKRAARRLEQATSAAFAAAAARVVRDGDLLAHDSGKDWFAVLMLARAREHGSAQMIDARSALERIATTISLETGRRMECGWWPIETGGELEPLDVVLEHALERGAREREHYEFLAAVGHELRTPLTSIRGYIETLLDDEVDAATARRFLQTARNEALRLGRLVDGILDFSFLDLRAGTRTATEVRSAVRAAIDALDPVAREAGVLLETAIDDEYDARIAGDACMHVLLNLLENGIKYARRDGIVRASIERQDPYLCIHIDDDGPGVPESERSNIFNLGERASAPARTRGKGIGLAIVRTIVERAGGKVRVVDSPLGGARFVVELPSIQAEMQPVLS